MCELTLFVRSKSGVRLSSAGERLIAHGHRLLAMSDEVYLDFRELQLEGNLRIAITYYFRPCTLPNILRRVRNQFPRLRLHVSIRKIALIEDEMPMENSTSTCR